MKAHAQAHVHILKEIVVDNSNQNRICFPSMHRSVGTACNVSLCDNDAVVAMVREEEATYGAAHCDACVCVWEGGG